VKWGRKLLGSRAWHALAGCTAAVSFWACAADEKAPGQLVVAFDTDMALPQQVDTLRVQVLSRGQLLLSQPYQVGPGRNDFRVPGTLTIVAGDEPAAPVTVTVAGSKQNKWRAFRDLTTTIPRDRVATLRMPIQWLCTGDEGEYARVVSTPTPGGGVETHVLSACDEGNTCVAGSCVPSTVEESTLPTYDPRDVFGGTEDPEEGACFDTIACLVRGKPVAPDVDCTIELPLSPTENINIGLRVPANNGICDSTMTTCFVPLDGNSPEGWQVTAAGDRIQLPRAVCEGEQSRAKREQISGIFVSTDCVTKSARLPPCGDWSSVPKTAGKVITLPDINDVRLPTASLVLSLLPAGGTTRLCCPLLQDGDKLYTCSCDTRTGANVHELRPKENTATPIKLPGMSLPGVVSTIRGGVLYWTTDATVERVSLADPMTALTPWNAPMSLYKKDGVLLGDAQGLYALSPVGGDMADANTMMPRPTGEGPVQLIAFDNTGKVAGQTPLGNYGVLQFAQTETALFLGMDKDQLMGATTRRTSNVVRVDKATRARSNAFPDQIVMTDQPDRHGGYLAVLTDGTTLYAVFEGTPEAGVTHFQVHALDIAEARGSTPPRTLYDLPVSGQRSELKPIGALDGALLVARLSLSSDGMTVTSSTLLLLRRAGGPASVVADFAGRYPLPSIAADADNVYWFNDDAKLYSFPRAALREAP